MGALGNTPRSTTVVTLEARKSYALGLQFLRAADDVALDLTGCTVRVVVAAPQRKGGAVLLTKTATAVNLPLGLLQLELQASDLDLAEDEYPFSATLVSANGYSSPLMKGVFDVRGNADPSTTGTYTGINPSTNLAVYVEQGDVLQVRVDKVDGLYVVVSTLIDGFTSDMQTQVDNAAMEADNAQAWASAAAASKTDAAASATMASNAATSATSSASAAALSEANAATSAQAASAVAANTDAAAASAAEALSSKNAASASATAASSSATAANTSATNANTSSVNAASSADAAAASAAQAESVVTGDLDPVIANKILDPTAQSYAAVTTRIQETAGTGNAVDIAVTPTGNIAAVNVQAALAELDAEKAAVWVPQYDSAVYQGALVRAIMSGASQAIAAPPTAAGGVVLVGVATRLGGSDAAPTGGGGTWTLLSNFTTADDAFGHRAQQQVWLGTGITGSFSVTRTATPDQHVHAMTFSHVAADGNIAITTLGLTNGGTKSITFSAPAGKKSVVALFAAHSDSQNWGIGGVSETNLTPTGSAIDGANSNSNLDSQSWYAADADETVSRSASWSTPSSPDRHSVAYVAVCVEQTSPPQFTASEIGYGGSTNLSATNVEAALDELDTEKAAVGHTHAASAGLFRGQWASDTLVYSETFAGASVAAPLTTTQAGTGAVSISGTGDDRWADVKANNYLNSNYAELRLALADLAVTGITRVRFKYATTNTAAGNWASTIQQNATTLFSQTSGSPVASTTLDVAATGTDVFTWRHQGREGVSGAADAALRVSDIEVYAAADPYMLGEFVIHLGKLWKSNTDNNSGTPGTSGWTEVPIYDNAIAGVTASRPTAQDAGTSYFDTTLNKPVWWTGSVWVDSTGTTV